MSSEKLARRKKMGDDPTAMSMSNTTEAGAISAEPMPGLPQPMPGMPQGPGNLMNNPMVGQSMGGGAPTSGSLSGMNMYPYNDGGLPSEGDRTGSIGYAENSGTPQNLIPGTGMNQQAYGTQVQPQTETQLRMDSLYAGTQAAERAAKLYAANSNGDPKATRPSYQVGPMGMMGTPVEINAKFPPAGGMPAAMDYRNENELSLQGMPDAQQAASMAMGLDTNRGGGRNTPV